MLKYAGLNTCRREQRQVCRLHFSEQYFTFSQSLAHFLRHSNGRPQRSQTLGGNPFFVLASAVTASGYPPKEKSSWPLSEKQGCQYSRDH